MDNKELVERRISNEAAEPQPSTQYLHPEQPKISSFVEPSPIEAVDSAVDEAVVQGARDSAVQEAVAAVGDVAPGLTVHGVEDSAMHKTVAIDSVVDEAVVTTQKSRLWRSESVVSVL